MKKLAIAILVAAVAIAAIILLIPGGKRQIDTTKPTANTTKIKIPELPKEKPDPGKIANAKNPFLSSPEADSLDTKYQDLKISKRKPPIKKLPEEKRTKCGQLRAKLLSSKITPEFIKQFKASSFGKYESIVLGFSQYQACLALNQNSIEPCKQLHKVSEWLERKCELQWIFLHGVYKQGVFKDVPRKKVVEQLKKEMPTYVLTDVADWVLGVYEAKKNTPNVPDICEKQFHQNELTYNICKAAYEGKIEYCDRLISKEATIFCLAGVELVKYKENPKASWNPAEEHPDWPKLFRDLPIIMGIEKGKLDCKEVLIDWIDKACQGEPYHY